MKLNFKVIAFGIVLVVAFIGVYYKGANDGQTDNVMTLVKSAEAKKAESKSKLSPVKARARELPK